MSNPPGTPVGTVSGISRSPSGHIERIRITTDTSLGKRVFIVKPASFASYATGCNPRCPPHNCSNCRAQ